MPKIPTELFVKLRSYVAQLDSDWTLWEPHYREMAELILPRRYVYLTPSSNIGPIPGQESNNALQRNTGLQQNKRILDPTGTVAARTLAHGLMNGVTSPARPWFRLRLAEFADDIEGYPQAYIVWLEEVARRMHIILGESNFYNAIGILYLELVVFGTATFIIYEDFDDVIRCYNSPCGEYRLILDHRRMVSGMVRHFNLTVEQTVAEFGIENVHPTTRAAYVANDSTKLQTISITHLIQQNKQDDGIGVDPRFEYREMFWESGRQTDGTLLRLAGYTEKPLIAARWEVTGNDTYGHSPTMDALPEIRQLQLETKQKAQALDKMIRPPIVADNALSAQPTALLPGGVSYVPSSSTVGAKPVFTVQPPLGEMTQDMRDLQNRIREIYYNNLFRNVSSLDTVRSAAEIYERKSEDMVLLGAVLERFESEALSPALKRTFGIMLRKELLPPPPPGLDPASLDIQYVSILFDAQRAAAVGSMERGMQVLGQLAGTMPQILDVPDPDELVREYWARLNIPASTIRSREDVAEQRAAREEQLAAQENALVGNELTQAAKNLSETDTGGGTNALQLLSGGAL